LTGTAPSAQGKKGKRNTKTVEAKNQGSTAPAPGHGYRWRTLGPTSARARAHAMGLGKRSISSADRKRYPRTPQEKACSIFMCGRSRGLGQASRRTRVGSMGHGPGAGPVCGATVGTRLPIFRGATQKSPFHLMGGQCLAPSVGATRRVGCREIDRVCGRPGSHVFNRFLRVSAAVWRKSTPSPPARYRLSNLARFFGVAAAEPAPARPALSSIHPSGSPGAPLTARVNPLIPCAVRSTHPVPRSYIHRVRAVADVCVGRRPHCPLRLTVSVWRVANVGLSVAAWGPTLVGLQRIRARWCRARASPGGWSVGDVEDDGPDVGPCVP